MTRRDTFRVPQRPDALKNTGPLPYWGERRPPKNFSDVFRAYAATEETSGSDGEVTTRTIATLRMYGPIYDGWFGISARSVSEALDELGDVDEIRVRINSPGGDAWEGMTILNMFRAHPAEVIAVVDGVAASAASYVAAGCDQTVMSPGTQLMIHDASAFAYGPEATMLKAATFLRSVSNAIASVYAGVAGGTDADWRALMIETTWYTAQEAVDAGLADRVAVVPDAGLTDTAPDEAPELDDDADVEDQWDLSMYPYAGRSQAPAPAAITRHTKPPTASADGSTQPEGAAVVDLNDQQIASLREQVGFAEDADADTIVAAVTEALTERANDDPPPDAGAPAGSVVVSKAEWEEMRGDAQRGAAAAQRLHETEREAALDTYRDRYLPANRQSWREEYDRNPKATIEALEKRPIVIPLDEQGHELDSEGSSEQSLDDVRSEPAYQNWRM